MNSNCLFYYLGKTVLVEADGIGIVGKLVRFEKGNRKLHKPIVLILQNSGNYIIVRFWKRISEVKT